jgi:uncharacterized protein (TIGR02145 family)
MKTSINSSRRTSHTWSISGPAFLTFLIFLTILSCQKDESSLITQGPLTGLSATAISTNTGILYYGHKTFTRSTGQPIVETTELVNPDFEHFDSNFTLKIQNGKDKKTRVSSAEIWIDGRKVVEPSDFSKNVPVLTKQIGGLTPESILEIRLNSAPESFIDLWIEGTLKPGRSYINNQGGSVVSEDGNVILTILPNTVKNLTLFSITESNEEIPKVLDGNYIGKVYKLEPSGIRFNNPINITLNYTDLMPLLINPENVGVLHWDPESFFENVSVNNDITYHELRFSLHQFSYLTEIEYENSIVLFKFYWIIDKIKWYFKPPSDRGTSYLTKQNIEIALNAWGNETSSFTFEQTNHFYEANIEFYEADDINEEDYCPIKIFDYGVDRLGSTCFDDWTTYIENDTELDRNDKAKIFIASSNFTNNINAIKTIAHEVGHALGIAHPPVEAMVFQPSKHIPPVMQQGNREFLGLQQWDINALHYHYSPASTITDADNNVYKKVKIGNQVWMAENLKTTKFNDGTPIPYITENADWVSRSTPAFCYLDNKINNKNIYGALYNYYCVETNKLCPTGWHVSSNEDWIALTNYLGGENYAGGKLKEAGTAHWKTDYVGVTNESGFTALPGGNRQGTGFFGNNYLGRWWTTSTPPNNQTNILGRTMLDFLNSVFTDSFIKMEGFSIRCIKN